MPNGNMQLPSECFQPNTLQVEYLLPQVQDEGLTDDGIARQSVLQ